jgi:hypothetical protein
MAFADHHDMVKAFSSNRSNHTLGIGVLPGRAWRDDRLLDAERLGLTRKSFSINLISVPDQMPWGLLRPARRSWLSTTSTNRTRKVAVGTVTASAAGACNLRPSLAIPSGLTSAARHGSSAHPRAGWRGSSAESALGAPAAPPAGNSANSSRAGRAGSRRAGP